MGVRKSNALRAVGQLDELDAAELLIENAQLRDELARKDAELQRLWRLLGDPDRLRSRLLRVLAHAQKPILVAAGAAGAAFLVAMTTPLDEDLASFIRRVFAGDEVTAPAPGLPVYAAAPRIIYRDREVVVPSPFPSPVFVPGPAPSPSTLVEAAMGAPGRKHCPTTPPSPPPRCPPSPAPSSRPS